MSLTKDERILKIRSKMRDALSYYFKTNEIKYLNRFYRIFKFMVEKDL